MCRWPTLVAKAKARSFEIRVPDPERFAEQTRVLPVLHAPTGIPVDLVLAASPLETEFLRRARPTTVEGVLVKVATAEDVIVMKMLAGRGKDVDDARSILIAQRGQLELTRVRQLLTLLDQALDRSDLLASFNALEAALPTP